MVPDGATDWDVFREYVRQVLTPTLRPGDIVILDNLAAHDDAEVLVHFEAAWAAMLFLPTYSPDLNPTEKMWSKVKAFLRNAKARAQEELYAAIGKLWKPSSRRMLPGGFLPADIPHCNIKAL